MREAYASAVNELYDEALFELLTEACSLHRGQLQSGRSAADAERIVTQHEGLAARRPEPCYSGGVNRRNLSVLRDVARIGDGRNVAVGIVAVSGHA